MSITERDLQDWTQEAIDFGIKTGAAYLRAKLFPNLPQAELEEHKAEVERLLEALS